MAANTSTPIEIQNSLIVVVGKSKHRVHLNSMKFRSVLRTVSRRCEIEHKTDRRYSDGVESEKVKVSHTYQVLVLSILALVIDGKFWTTERIASLDEKEGRHRRLALPMGQIERGMPWHPTLRAKKSC